MSIYRDKTSGRSSLTLTNASVRKESALQNAFLALGIKAKPTHTTARCQQNSTPRPLALVTSQQN